ncbi:MAG TPA: GNAT family N-acetyltransferase [Armatimonadota bacterium]|jgi:GNAT superfamily N-acetyltransferase
MPDIVCPLFDVPDSRPLIDQLAAEGIVIRQARPWDRTPLSEFIRTHFSQGWVDEALRAFNQQPISLLLALDEKTIIGFAAYEVTARAYFGPTGVDAAYRGRGIGKALFLEALIGLRHMGYVYGFIGSPGPIDFYLKTTPGLLLPTEWRNIYTGAV